MISIFLVQFVNLVLYYSCATSRLAQGLVMSRVLSKAARVGWVLLRPSDKEMRSLNCRLTPAKFLNILMGVP